MDPEPYLAAVDLSTDRPVDFLDARDLPPPKPLEETMTRVADLEEPTVFVQLNDRVPQFLFPKLDERGIEYRTAEVEAGVVTAIWRPSAE
ncbi:DUF2249 domain-containing protein [Halobellus ruber]|uniref:DUF2249 domain-containing protein n=1 Tax=Halobellus ruber TaxID=2761102 RepID=A0A7J9SJC1_9EURY|nr:DUF2249 domain-containing protein [Halobellus ruber]MBB6646818.1 DUF2249 domain-containing protein [Halobellus ruber]